MGGSPKTEAFLAGSAWVDIPVTSQDNLRVRRICFVSLMSGARSTG